MQLVLHLPSGDFTIDEPNSTGAYRWLYSVGTLTLNMRSKIATTLFGTENANVTVSLKNARKRAADILGQPLRIKADVYNDDGSLYFSGIVQQVTYGLTMDLTLEA